MKVIFEVLYLVCSAVPLLVLAMVLRKWTLEMEQSPYWWVIQSIEQKWCWLATAGMSWLVISALGAFAFFGPA